MKLKLEIQRFSATNSTTHYDLSQYTANDKPTYLIDYNGDMAKIDAAIYAADARSLVNESAIGTLSDLNTTTKTDLVSAINEVNTQVGTNTNNIGTNTANIATLGGNIGNLVDLTTTAKNNLVAAINEVKGVNDTQNTNIGDLSNLDTNIKTSIVAAINEIFETTEHNLIWTNTNPSAAFGANVITINDLNTYDQFKIISIDNNQASIPTQHIVECYKDANILVCQAAYFNGVSNQIRNIKFDFTNNTINFERSQIPGTGYNDNTNVPVYIIGYRSGLFN